MNDSLRRHVAILARSRPFARWTQRALAARTKIVYAHHVGATGPHLAAFGPGLTAEQLDAHLTTLGRHLEFAPLEQVLAANDDHADAARCVAVTFDDGFDLIAGGAADVLRAHGVKATTFVLTAMLDNRGLMWRNKLSAIRTLRPARCVGAYNALAQRVGLAGIDDASQLLGAAWGWDMARKDELADELWAACDMPPLAEFLDEHRPYFSADGLARWLADGHAVGLHTATHPDCSRLDAAGLHSEIREPARRLQSDLGIASLCLSYPFGRRCAPAHELSLAESGIFACALGIRGFSPRGTDRLRLERASIEGDMHFSVYGKAFLHFPR
ncbi:MAG TPA: polysaccharide deacetylase family protein [Solirubrobacteraceae bacterium]